MVLCAMIVFRYMLVLLCILTVVFFKQKTAYEMRISDCSSDVCSSDLDISLALICSALVTYTPSSHDITSTRELAWYSSGTITSSPQCRFKTSAVLEAFRASFITSSSSGSVSFICRDSQL